MSGAIIFRQGGGGEMSLKERVYSILVVSAGERFNASVRQLLPESVYDPVCLVTSVSAAQRAAAERSFDFILLNSPLPDDPGLRFAADRCQNRETVVLLLVRSELYGQIYDRVADRGVFVLAKPAPKGAVIQALDWMISARERLRRLDREIQPLETKMEEIQLVNRAKWVLIRERNMSEPEAHHYLERRAMDRCISKRQAAEEIIAQHA